MRQHPPDPISRAIANCHMPWQMENRTAGVAKIPNLKIYLATTDARAKHFARLTKATSGLGDSSCDLDDHLQEIDKTTGIAPVARKLCLPTRPGRRNSQCVPG